MSPARRLKLLAGFTLVELLISITIVATMLAWVAPAFKDSMMNHRILSQTNAFLGGLNYARTTALHQNINVRVCPVGSINSTTCGNSWATGWMIVTAPATGTAVILQAYRTAPNDPIVSSISVDGVPASTLVTFDSRGLATTQAYFKLCDSRGGAYARSLEVLPTGFVQYSSTMGASVWDGSTLACP